MSTILGNRAVAVIVDGRTSPAEIAILLEAGVTVYTSSPSFDDPTIIESTIYQEPKAKARHVPERQWIQSHPRSPRKSK